MSWAAVIGGTLAAAGTIGGAAISSNNSKGGSGGGGSGTTNPAAGVLGELFGYMPYYNSKGQFKWVPFDRTLGPGGSAGPGRVTGISNGLFGDSFYNNVQNYINNAPDLNQRGDILNMLASVPGLLDNTMGLFDKSIIPAAQDLVNTGFRTDIQPVRDYAHRQFERVDLPTLAEMFAGQTGTFATDFNQSAQQAAADMEAQLGALQAQYDESANQRRATGIPVLSQLATTRLGLPSATANDLFATNQALYNFDQSRDPGLRGLNIFTTLSGLGAPSQLGPTLMGQQPSATSSLLAGMGNMAPGFGQAVANLPWDKMGNWLSNLFTSNSSMYSTGPTGAGNYTGPDSFNKVFA